jgi:hypothetical protein
MFRRLGFTFVVASALVLVPVALGAYPTPFAQQGGAGVQSSDGGLRFVAVAAGGGGTRISAIRTKDRANLASRTVSGRYGIPMLTQNGLAGGLFHDGRTLVLQSMGKTARTSFLLVSTDRLAPRGRIALNGTFGFDALSPNGSRLYLIQNMSAEDLEHYVVRAYDLDAHRLLPGRIADKTQKDWVMQGLAVNRVTSRDGRWVYTLYMNPGGYPFIHALDAVHGVAHCVGLPWREANQGPVFKFQMSLKGHSLVVRWQDGRIYRVVDRTTWRVSKPQPGVD